MGILRKNIKKDNVNKDSISRTIVGTYDLGGKYYNACIICSGRNKKNCYLYVHILIYFSNFFLKVVLLVKLFTKLFFS